MKKKLLELLRENPRARERKHKDAAIVFLLQKNYPSMEYVPQQSLIDFVQHYSTMDRQWRQFLEQHPELRGKDYGEKASLVHKKLASLGYI